MPAEKSLVHGGWDCTEVYPKLNNASAGPNEDDGLPTAWFLGQTFRGLAIQISDRINLPYSFSTGSLLNCLACAAWTQYSLRPPRRRAKTEESIILVLARNGRPRRKSARTTR
jgi:hypothetical protein